MKVLVTFLAAPWPEGTVPGHLVELAGCDAVPAWAVGKCTPADDDAEAVSVWPRAVAPAELPAAPAPAGEMVVNPASAEAPEGGEQAAPAEPAAPAEAPQPAAIPAKPKRSASA